MKLKDTGLLPEKKECPIQHILKDSPENCKICQQAQGANWLRDDIGEIDITAWLEENGYINASIEEVEKIVELNAEKWGYIKLSQVELDVEKLSDLIVDTINFKIAEVVKLQEGFDCVIEDDKGNRHYVETLKIAQAICDSKPFKEEK